MWQSELFVAAAEGHLEDVERLLKADHDPNEENWYGFTPVLAAAQYAQPATLHLLIEFRGDVNHTAKVGGMTPLSVAQRDAARGGPMFGRTRGHQRGRDALIADSAEVVNLIIAAGAEMKPVSSVSFFAAPKEDRVTAERVLSGHLRGGMQPVTFNDTKFRECYLTTNAPEDIQEYEEAVKALLLGFLAEKGCDPSNVGTAQQVLDIYLKELKETCPSGTVKEMAERTWTSFQVFPVADGEYEFCSILNWALWHDEHCLDVARIVRALNLFCVGQPAPGARRPRKAVPRITYRGGGFEARHRDFFQVGTMFRAPPFVPTSASEDTAKDFVARSRCPERIIWSFEFPKDQECSHVNHICKRAIGVDDEDEWLFAAYSVFKVLKADWRDGTAADPHQVLLQVFADNLAESEFLPCSPWA